MSDDDDSDRPPRRENPHEPPTFQSDGFFPRIRQPIEKQVVEHHEVLRKHATQFGNVFTWQRDLHRRITELEDSDPSQAIASFRAEFRGAKRFAGILTAVIGTVWTIIITVVGILISIYLRK